MQNWKKNAAVFVASQSISLFGSSLVQFAITWYVTLTTQSGIYMTVSIACTLLPLLFMSPFAGVWADRYDRKKLIMISDGVIAASTLVLAIVFMAGYESIWLLFVVSVIRSLGGAVQSPAVNALLPSLVPDEQLTRINGINGSVQSLLSLAAPALGGALLSLSGSIVLIMFIDVVTAAIAIIVMLRFLRIPAMEPSAGQATGYGTEIKAGLSYIRRHGYLLHILLYTLGICFLIAPVAFLTPLQVVRTYGEETWRMTASQMAYTAGMLGGGLLITVWSGFKNRIYTMSAAVFLMGTCTMLLGMGVPFGAYLAFTAGCGMMMPFLNTPAIVTLQERVAPSYLGRVFSVLTMGNGAMMPLGMLLFGPLSDYLSIELLLIITGSMVLLISAVFLLDRTIRSVAYGKSAQANP